jgi:hypothetical protein
VRSEDLSLLQAVTTPPLHTSSARRLAQEGVPPADAERGIAAIERALADEGPLAVGELRERVARAGVRSEGQAMYHLLFQASLRGLVVRGPMVDGKHAYVLVRDWLGDQRPVDREKALAELARRYLAGHGPASDRDLARWAGIPLRDARAGLSAIAGQLEDRGGGFVDLMKRPPAAELPPPKLLGAYEPVLLGWISRKEIFGDDRSFATDARLFDPFAMVRGRVAARWRLKGQRVELEPIGRLGAGERAALDMEAQDAVRFLAIG